jgi:hypothetical protein
MTHEKISRAAFWLGLGTESVTTVPRGPFDSSPQNSSCPVGWVENSDRSQVCLQIPLSTANYIKKRERMLPIIGNFRPKSAPPQFCLARDFTTELYEYLLLDFRCFSGPSVEAQVLKRWAFTPVQLITLHSSRNPGTKSLKISGISLMCWKF